MSSEREHRPVLLRSVSAPAAESVSQPRHADPSAPETIQIVRTAALVEAGGVVARFELDSMPHPMWRGAFGRALEGNLVDLAGRWHLDHAVVVVTRVQAGRAADVATVVHAAVDAANGYIAGRADEGAARLAAALAAEAGLRREANEAATALQATLGV